MQLTSDEDRRLQILTSVLEKATSVRSAARTLRLSERQVYRLLAQLRRRGPEGIRHGNKGRKPLNKIDAAVWEQVLELARTSYARMNDTQILGMLRRRHHIVVSYESLRKRLREAGIPPKSRRPATTRKAHVNGDAVAHEQLTLRSAHHQ